MLLALGAFLVLSAVRTLTGGYDLTSSGTIAAGLSAAVPIGLAGLGGLWSERAGVVNIGLEGMMILGTWGCAYLGWNHGPWAGVLFGTLLGALGGLVHAVATVTFGVDHIISGVAVNIIAPGFALYLTKITFAHDPGGGQKQSPPINDAAVDHVAVLALVAHDRGQALVRGVRPGRPARRPGHQPVAGHACWRCWW